MARQPFVLCVVAIGALIIGACSSSQSATPPPASSTTTSTSVADARPVVGIDGNGPKVVALPSTLSLPEIVHARYSGSGNFVVKSRSANGTDTGILAVANGQYDGTFPVGFVDARGAPTTALDIEASGPWHLDIAPAALAPRLNAGVSGSGDAVLAYDGPRARFRVRHAAKMPFVLRTFGATDLRFARVGESIDTPVDIPAGPLFVAVTSPGIWSITADKG